MKEQDGDYILHRVGDKVRLNTEELRGERGVIHAIGENEVAIYLNTGGVVSLPQSSLTNLSLAARKAWKTMRAQ